MRKLTWVSGMLPAGMLMAVLLSGCAPPPQLPATPATQGMGSTLRASIQQIAAVTDELRAAHNVAYAPDYRGFPLRAPSAGAGHVVPLSSVQPAVGIDQLPQGSPLLARVYTQWSGPLSPFLSRLAAQMGWQYADRLQGYTDPDVVVKADNAAVLSVLQDISRQTPASVVVRVLPGRLVLEHRSGYRDIPDSWRHP